MSDPTTTPETPTAPPVIAPTKPDASASPAGDVDLDLPAPPPGVPPGVWRELHALRSRAKAAEVRTAQAETALASTIAESAAKLSAAQQATAEAAAFARVEALHPVVADPEVREELRHAYARYQAREGANAAPVGTWLAEVAPTSKLYGHLFAAPPVAGSPPPVVAPPTPKTDPNAGAQNSAGAPPSGRMTVEAFRAIKNPTEADYRRLAESSGLKFSDTLITSMAKGR